MPQIVFDAKRGRTPNMTTEERMRLQNALRDESKVVEQFSILLIAFCHSNPILSNCFGQVADYTELLLPNDILADGGFIDMLNHTDYITDEDYKTTELLGWLYQFYISERKDEVFASFKDGKKAAAEDIPAATQIFTPNWIVKYMVQNTIGRIYLDNEPYSDLKSAMQYVVDIEPTPKEHQFRYNDLSELTMIDPACGSGHILLEGFDLLLKMYQEAGYTLSQAIEQIFRKNLIGIELDTRAKQLSMFALMLKACQHDRSFADAHVLPRVIDMPSVDVYTWREDGAHMVCNYELTSSETINRELDAAFTLLKQADNLGSIMQFHISPATRRFMEEAILHYEEDSHYTTHFAGLMHGFRLILALTDKYATVVANPPYMGNGNMNKGLSDYVKNHYGEGKADLCTVFVQVFRNISAENGIYAYIIPPSWLFLSGFEDLRRSIIDGQKIESMLHLSRGVFGADFGSVATTIRNTYYEKCSGTYFRLIERTFQEFDQSHLKTLFEKTLKDHNFRYLFAAYSKEVDDINYSEYGARIYYPKIPQSRFDLIPGVPIGYWISDNFVNIFSYPSLDTYGHPIQGSSTGDNKEFMRLWHEVSEGSIDFNHSATAPTLKKWYPFCKGGGDRRWYGNNEYVVNWQNDGRAIRNCAGSAIRNPNANFKQGLTWSGISSNKLGIRYCPEGYIFSVSGKGVVDCGENDLYILGLCCSEVANEVLKVTSPTMSFEVGYIAAIPTMILEEKKDTISSIVKDNIALSRKDWDAHETSWDFEYNEIVWMATHAVNLSGAQEDIQLPISAFVESFRSKWSSLFYQLHQNEEELNRQFINIYGLQDELTPDVPLEDITILQQGEISIENNQLVWHEDVLMKQLISYLVGVVMGRYRIDKPGLHIAHPEPSVEEVTSYPYNGKTIKIDDDAIIPILPDDSPFADNLCNRVKDLIRIIFGDDILTQNLNYIEQTLGKSINDYLQKDFYADHKRMYQNRPIYWLFSSKKGAFRCLTYMHRMDAYTAEKVRSKYLLPYMDSLRQKIEHLRGNNDLTGAQRRELTNMQKAYDECQEYHERLHTVAGEQIAFDLDDGVVVNYAKFGDVLAKRK